MNFLADIRKSPFLCVTRRLLGAFLRMFRICLLSGNPERFGHGYFATFKMISRQIMASRRKLTSTELLGTLLGTFPDGLQEM